MKYSIVTPLYNSWNLMGNLLRSLENQTFKDFEFIVIDDCSKDDTYEKILKYKESSSLNILVKKNDKNFGPGYARNCGIGLAKGDWITFVDSDDSISTDFLQQIDFLINQNKYNCIVFDYFVVRKKKTFAASSVYGNHKAGELSLHDAMIDVRNHSPCKVYNRQVLVDRGITFPALRRCEDVAFVCRAIEACKTVYYLKKPLYYYNQHLGSLSTDISLDESDMIRAYEVLQNNLGERYQNEISIKSISDLLYGGVLMMCKSRKANKEILNFIEKYNDHFPNWYDNAVIRRLGKAKMIFLFGVHRKNVMFLKLLTQIHTLLLK